MWSNLVVYAISKSAADKPTASSGGVIVRPKYNGDIDNAGTGGSDWDVARGDVALVFLRTAVTWEYPAYLPQAGEVLNAGDEVSIVGWGMTLRGENGKATGNTHTHTHLCTHARARARARARAHTHAHACAHTHRVISAHTRTRTRTQARTDEF